MDPNAPDLDLEGVPSGYGPLARRSPFTDLIGPLYTRGTGRAICIGLRVGDKHCNSRGLLHGGVVSSLSDLALGYAAVLGADPPLLAVTASLHVDYLEPVRLGSWVEASMESSVAGRHQVFATGNLRVTGQVVARASAVFAIRPPPAKP